MISYLGSASCSTRSQRRIAEQRELFMRDFLKQYFDECGEGFSALSEDALKLDALR
ncbi:MAG: hypothetical protein R3C56_20740 [Pirellulaceae bacterium]